MRSRAVRSANRDVPLSAHRQKATFAKDFPSPQPSTGPRPDCAASSITSQPPSRVTGQIFKKRGTHGWRCSQKNGRHPKAPPPSPPHARGFWVSERGLWRRWVPLAAAGCFCSRWRAVSRRGGAPSLLEDDGVSLSRSLSLRPVSLSGGDHLSGWGWIGGGRLGVS